MRPGAAPFTVSSLCHSRHDWVDPKRFRTTIEVVEIYHPCYVTTVPWKVVYYEDETGHESVVEEIGAFPKKAQAKILRFVDLLEEEGPVRLGADYTSHIDGDIWELRIDSGSDRFRVLYFTFVDRTVVLLRAFLKKTRRTPRAEIATALRRSSDFRERMTVTEE